MANQASPRVTQQTALPGWVMDSPEMEEIIKECNLIIIVYVPSHVLTEWLWLWLSRLAGSMTFYHSKRRLYVSCPPFPPPYTNKVQATDCVVNLVPVLYKSGQPLDKVIPRLIQEMQASRDRLDSAAAKLDSKTREYPQLNKNVMRFIEGIRIMDTGTLAYSYVGSSPTVV